MEIIEKDIILKMLFGDPKEYKPYPKTGSKEENTSDIICKTCDGKCCKMCGCHYSPDDFNDLSFEGLKSKMDLGYISIDIVFGEQYYVDRDYLILRARNKNADIYDAKLSGGRNMECSLLTNTGCVLPYEERPSGGKLLIPNEKYNCKSNYDIEQCILEWKHF